METVIVMINNSNLSEQEFVDKLSRDTIHSLPEDFSRGIELSRLEQAFHDIARCGYEALVDQIFLVSST